MQQLKLFPETAYERFELDKILEKIATGCQSEQAMQLARDLRPVTSLEEIDKRLDECREYVEMREAGLALPESDLPLNIQKDLGLLSVANSVLEGRQLINIAELTERSEGVRVFLQKKEDLFPSLHRIVDPLDDCRNMRSAIEAVLEPNGFVKSSASKALSSIRGDLARLRQKASRAFEGFIRKYRKLGWLREYDETFYNDRRVLAVVAEHKREVHGLIHGTSETGSTAFIEPSGMVNINNDLIEAREEEKREEYRILDKLTREVREYLPQLRMIEDALAYLDLVRSRAKLARAMDASRPAVLEERKLELFEAYHPLLLLQNKQEGKDTIPLSIHFDKEKRVVVISGPNAGGKSIALKTVGLIQLMVQCGLMVPIRSDSQLSVFRKLFVDIGDDQSIAFELSTYSSRLHKMKHFLTHADKHTFFFIDEFGTGSDPELGGAMAETILEDLLESRAIGMVTTHYANLKIMAEQSPHAINASMQFDENTLDPLYQLVLGHPGSSYTFEVAEKIGLDKRLIERAQEKLDSKKVKLDKLLVTLQTKKNQLNRETHQLQQQRGKVQREIDSYKEEVERLAGIRDKLNTDENQRLVELGQKYESLMEHWKKNRSKKELQKKVIIMAEKELEKERKEDEVEQLRQKKERIRAQKAQKKAGKTSKKPRKPVEEGARVKMKGSKQAGTVESIQKDKAVVVFGMMKTIVPVKDLKVI